MLGEKASRDACRLSSAGAGAGAEAIVGLLMTKYRVSVSEGSGKFGSVRFGRRDSKT